MVTVDLALAGVGVGAVAALAAVGLITSYRATGVFNLSFGAVAMIIAYLLWQQVRRWGWPLWPSAVVDVCVVAPLLGLVLERYVFRGLSRRGAGPAQTLVASLGVFVLLVGVAVMVWGGAARLDPPSLFPSGSLDLPAGASIPKTTVAELSVVVAVAVTVGLVTAYTPAGRRLRAVVDGRELAELSGVAADRIAAAGWAFGSALAGLTGVLLAPHLRLDPYGLTLVVLETMGVVVLARLSSLTVAILAALAIGVGQSELTRLRPTGWAQDTVQSLQSNLFVVVMLLALLVLPRMAELGAPADRVPPTAGRRGLPAVGWVPFVLLLAAPLLLGGDDLRSALKVPALAVVFVSVVVVTGYAGQISLGQIGYAGLGALLAGSLASGTFFGLPPFPGLAALVVASLLVVPVGLVTGWPAIRRRGLTLALTTFAVAAVVSRFVFAQPAFTKGVHLDHPTPFTGDRAFYLLELVCLGAVLLLVRRLRGPLAPGPGGGAGVGGPGLAGGRLGRMLTAVRDDEDGAAACGIDVAHLKVFVFGVGSGVAALGGALLAMGGRAFDATQYDPVQGLVWFAAVVVFGVDSAAGAVLAAALLVGLDAGTRSGVSTIVVGVLAVLLSRMPGGVVGTVRELAAAVSPTVAGPTAAPSTTVPSTTARASAEAGVPPCVRPTAAGAALRAVLRTPARSPAAPAGPATAAGGAVDRRQP